MNSIPLDAVYRDGAFKPIHDSCLNFKEGEVVRLSIERAQDAQSNDVLTLATEVYHGLSEAEIEEVERIAGDRRDFFGPSDESLE